MSWYDDIEGADFGIFPLPNCAGDCDTGKKIDLHLYLRFKPFRFSFVSHHIFAFNFILQMKIVKRV